MWLIDALYCAECGHAQGDHYELDPYFTGMLEDADIPCCNDCECYEYIPAIRVKDNLRIRESTAMRLTRTNVLLAKSALVLAKGQASDLAFTLQDNYAARQAQKQAIDAYVQEAHTILANLYAHMKERDIDTITL